MSNNNDITNFIDEDFNEPEFKETIFPYLRKWKWFVLSIIIFLMLGYVYTKLTTPLYKIETDLLIKDNKDKMNGQNDLLKDLDLFTSDKIIDNEVQILKSKTLLEKVIGALKLETSYINIDGIRKREMYGNVPFEVELIAPYTNAYKVNITIRLFNDTTAEVNGKSFPINIPLKTEAGLILIRRTKIKLSKRLYEVNFKDLADIVKEYSDNLNIEPVSKQATTLIITLEDAIPDRGKDFLNRLVEEYSRAALQDKNKETSNTLNFINSRLEFISQELGSVEKNVEQYKSQNRITDISSESQIFLQSVQDNDSQLNKVLIQLSILQNLESYLGQTSNNATLPSMLGIEDPTLLGLVNQLGETELRKLSLLQTVPETNPVVATYNDQIDALKTAIEASVQNLKKGLQITKQQLQEKNDQAESIIKSVPTKERGLLDVMRQQDIKNALYTYLLQKHEETAMQLASGVADSRIIDVAWSSKDPVKPVKKAVYLMFLLLGIVIPAIIIYLKGLLNSKVTRKADIERFTKAPILAEISHTNNTESLLVVSKPRSMVAEQIRSLRTNLQFVMPKDDQKVILFTSSLSGEGKSFVSLNLGASLAMSGKKVVILELDLRMPKLHSSLEISNELGLSNYLIGKASIDQIVKEISLQKDYYIVTCGPIPPNPAELLVNGHIGKLIEQLKKNFDYIILDAPPVGLVTDAQILSAYSDATMFIIRHNYTAKSNVHSIDNLYRNKKFTNMNIIMNSIDIQNSYGYGYGYGYGYNSYYEEEDMKFSKIGRLFNGKKVK